jgi:uncharacterized protein (TIGR00255 family)
MTSSMTGFSFKDKSTQGGSLIIEIKTLNSRYYELNLKTSDLFKIYESKIREIIAAKVFRGKVDCKIFYRTKENSSKQLIDSKELKNLIVSSENIAKKLKNPAPIDPLDIFQLLSNQNLNISEKNLKKEILSLLEEAIQDLVTDRRREGVKIRQVIIKNLRAIENIINKAKKIIPKAIKNHQKKVIKKFKDALINVDDARLKQEFLLFIQKSDVTEEIDRIESHIIELRRLINLNGPTGKKIDFLMQEFNREANTIGSKSVSVDISKISVELKVLIEQVREQIQNIE